jgi:hypothetical protein
VSKQAGDEAEKANLLPIAVKNYKHYYLCARALGDTAASMLALNRLGLVYSLIQSPQDSFECH